MDLGKQIIIDELTDAIITLIDTNKAYKEGMADCEGTWGYYGREYIDNWEKAKANFADVFGKYVEELLGKP